MTKQAPLVLEQLMAIRLKWTATLKTHSIASFFWLVAKSNHFFGESRAVRIRQTATRYYQTSNRTAGLSLVLVFRRHKRRRKDTKEVTHDGQMNVRHHLSNMCHLENIAA